MIEIVLPKKFQSLRNAIRFNKGSQWRKDREKITWLRGMSPKEFEYYISELFRRLGYRVSVSGGPGDGGIDVIAEKNGVKHYIQCKKYFKAREVSVGEVRDFYGALANRLANGKGYFITTSKFTLPAEKFVEDKPIELVDENRLIEYIRLAEKDDLVKSSPLEKCQKCSGNLIEKKGRFGKFYGCSNYPKCRFTKKS